MTEATNDQATGTGQAAPPDVSKYAAFTTNPDAGNPAGVVLDARLRKHHGVDVHEAVQTIEPTVVTKTEAELLTVPEFSPALLFERLTSDSDGHPVEYVHSIYRGDRYRIVSRLTLGQNAASPVSPGVGHHPGIPTGDFAYGDSVSTSTVGDVQEDH